MPQAPLISILVVMYNAEKYILATLKSCLNQTYNHFELLVLDNGSSDQTIEKLSIIHDPRIEVFKLKKNLGAYAGLNYLLEKAKGGLIAIQDHDDLWLPDKLNKQVNWLQENPEAAGCGTLMYYYFADKEMATVVSRAPWTSVLDHPSLVFKKTSGRYKPDHPAPDEEYLHQLQLSGKLGCLQTPLGIHRIHADKSNFSVRRSRMNVRGAIAHLQLTYWRDWSGAMQYILGGVLPNRLLWWVRDNFTMRSVVWISKKDLETRTGVTVG